MAELLIVRHAQVTADFTQPSAKWTISPEGIDASRQLARDVSFYSIDGIYSSPEPKAVATAEIIGRERGMKVQVMDDLRELYAPTIPDPHEFFCRVQSYFAGQGDDEFETYEKAESRIVGCVHAIIKQTHKRPVAVVSHGRILTVLFSYWWKRPARIIEWQAIRFPDLSVVNLDSRTVDRGFFSDLPDHLVGLEWSRS